MNLKNTPKPIIHIAPDEKFIDSAYEVYEKAFSGNNKFVILLKDRDEEVQHLSEERPYQFFYKSDDFIDEVIRLIREAQVVVFHSLTSDMARIALKIPEGLKKVWTVFGYEVYNNPIINYEKLYGEKTFDTFFGFKQRLKIALYRFFYRYINFKDNDAIQIKNAMQQMDYISVLFYEEYEFYQRLDILKKGSQILKFSYYPIDLVIDKKQSFIKDNNILLGNSSSYTNNHLDTFEILKNIDFDKRKIIVPLSYGSEEYAKHIIESGKSVFGNVFTPLTELLPLKEYQNILQQCGIVIMNHYRQQAVGTVLNTLYMGAKVYLSRNNTLYHYLKRIGCNVYCIEEDLTPENPSVLELLSDEQIKVNCEILKYELSLDRICNELNKKLGHFLD